MATRGDSGQLFVLLREASHSDARVGETFVLFSVLSIIGGLGLFGLTETFRFDAGAFWTYRTIAGGLVGYGLPALLYGIAVATSDDEGEDEFENRRATDVGVVGVLLAALAVIAFFVTYPEQWHGAGALAYVAPTLTVYALGVLLCSVAAGGAALAGRDGTEGGQSNRLGETLVLFSVLSVVGGVGLFVLTETFRFDAGAFWTYRTLAGGLVGYGLPASLYGVVVTRDGGAARTADVGMAGVVLAAFAGIAFFLTYPEQWHGGGAVSTVAPTLAIYALGVLLCTSAAGGTVLADRDAVADDGTAAAGHDATEDRDDGTVPTHPDADEETGFIWGSPPES
jgi:hypothetical protein